MFERFTEEARRTVVLAKELARQFGHDWIGTEHLMLALLDDPEGVAAQSLDALGISADAVRTEIELAVPAQVGSPGEPIPFTPRAKKVLELSLREAMQLRQRTIQPGHILLGLIREGEGVAGQALAKQGVNPDHLREQVHRRLVGSRLESGMRIVPPEPSDMTRAGVAAFDRARRLAAGKPVGSQHVLLGLFGEEDSLARQALTTLGVTREAVEGQLAALDPADTADEPPEQAAARRTRLQVSGDVVTLRIEDKELAGRLGTSLQRWGRRGAKGEIELPGTEPVATEAFARLWRTAHTVAQDIVHRMAPPGPLAPATGEWKPPGWSTRATVAGLSVTSEPDGPHSRLWIKEDLDHGEVRSWLAAWIAAKASMFLPTEEVSYFTVLAGRRGELFADDPDPDAWAVTNFSFGPGPAPADWPRRPLEELMSFAVTDLQRPSEPGPPG